MRMLPYYHKTEKDETKLRTPAVFLTIFLVWTLIIKQMTHVVIIILILVINSETMILNQIKLSLEMGLYVVNTFLDLTFDYVKLKEYCIQSKSR